MEYQVDKNNIGEENMEANDNLNNDIEEDKYDMEIRINNE